MGGVMAGVFAAATDARNGQQRRHGVARTHHVDAKMHGTGGSGRCCRVRALSLSRAMRWIFAAAALGLTSAAAPARLERPPLYDPVMLNIGFVCQWQTRCMGRQNDAMKRRSKSSAKNSRRPGGSSCATATQRVNATGSIGSASKIAFATRRCARFRRWRAASAAGDRERARERNARFRCLLRIQQCIE